MSTSDETASTPVLVRLAVRERDGDHCRGCGQHRGRTPLCGHHTRYGGDVRGMGGARVDEVDYIITVCYGCHAWLHSDKRLLQPLSFAVVHHPGVTIRQLQRWSSAGQRRKPRDPRYGATSLAKVEEIRFLHEQGWALGEIASHLGIPRATVRRIALGSAHPALELTTGQT